MSALDNKRVDFQPQAKGIILWLTGWSMPTSIFDRLCALLPDFHHQYADYSAADCPEEIIRRTEAAASELLRSDGATASRTPLLIAGWSLGGVLALRLAAQGRADGLVLFGATAKFVREREQRGLGWADAYLRQMLSGLAENRPAVEANFRKLVFPDTDGAAAASRTGLPATGTWTTPALMAGLHILRDTDLLPELAGIHCPVLVVHGVEDRICPYGAAEQLVSHLPRAELLSLPDCGHAPFSGKEDFMAEAMRRWFLERQNKGDSTPI